MTPQKEGGSENATLIQVKKNQEEIQIEREGERQSKITRDTEEKNQKREGKRIERERIESEIQSEG